MKSKSNLRLLYVAVGLLALAAVYNWIKEREISQAASPRRTLFAGATSATLTQISIVAPNTSDTLLTKKNNSWFVDPEKEFRADVNLMNQLLTTLESPIEGEVVSTNPDSFGEYHLTETSATRVKISGEGGKVVADLMIGKEGPSAFTSYVRAAGAKEVVAAKGSLTFLFRKPDGWRDRGILEIPMDSIIGIETDGSSSSVVLQRTSPNTWQVAGDPPKEAIAARVSSLLSGISYLRAMDFATLQEGQTLKDLGLDPPRQKVTVLQGDLATSQSNLKRTVILFGNESPKGGSIYTKRADNDALFLVPMSVVRQVAPPLEEVAILPPAPVSELLGDKPKAAGETTASVTSSDEKTTISVIPAEAAETTSVVTPEAATTKTPAPTATLVPTSTPAPTPEPTPTPTPTPVPTSAPTPTPAPTPEPTPEPAPVPPAGDSPTTPGATN
jgi:hypothetical protein